ncbi:MAG: Pls/PosA family non-ribosomal peptide synthetase [Hyphomicrobium sp.]|uniref:Pls/PosA family non-ribosomal peptide synthetase n=1 Tax=Hyphomicrobium sp. TaxID=82 RepID=UPI0035698DDB
MAIQEIDFQLWQDERPREPRLLHQHFEQQALIHPDHPAVEFSGQIFTYEELDCDANQIAHYLVRQGVGVGSLVGICLKKSPRLYAAMLGILKAGAAYVPIDPKWPMDRIRAIADDAQLRFIVSEGVLGSELDCELDTPVLALDAVHEKILLEPVVPMVDFERRLTPAALSYIIYTSGSTGRPKGVMIEHRNALAFVKSLKTVYGITEQDRVYQGFSTAFDASVEEIWAAFSRGGTLVVPTEEIQRSPADVADFINDNNITYFSTVPTMLAMIDRDLDTVTTLVLGGEACSNELVTRWARPGRRMLNTYGPTEATVVATWSECVSGVPVSIGTALPGYTTYVLDENMRPVAPGECGELFIGGAGVGRGYMNFETLTEQRFIANPFEPERKDRLYRTFDHVRLGDDGELYFLGRLDDQVKIRGFRIELSEIESVLIENPAIKAAAVAVTDIGEMKQLAAFIVVNDQAADLDRHAIAEVLRNRLPPYMVPQYLDVIEELPMMSSGKVDRKSLPRPRTLLNGPSEMVLPESDLEKRLAASWATAFQLSEISTTADFFVDLGGHSLLASQAVSLVRAAVPDAPISVRDFYDHRTVRQLANVLETRRASQQACSDDSVAQPRPIKKAAALTRWTVAALQAISIFVYYGIVAAPLAFVVVMATSVIDGEIAWPLAGAIMTTVGFALWPCALLFTVALKWMVIGRVKPGRYPLWSFYYFRWWLVQCFQPLGWAEMFSGTPLMSLYWRAMGAKIGRNVTLSTSLCGAFDAVSIGDGSSVGLETQILGYRVEGGYLVIAPVEIGANCFIGMHCNLGLDTTMGDGARLDDMSALSDATVMKAGEGRRGSPARVADVAVPPADADSRMGRRFLFGVLHLVSIYAMGYFLVATLAPSLALILGGLWLAGPLGGAIGAFVAVPVGILTYVGCVVLLVRVLRPLEAGSMSIYSKAYLKHWFVSYLLENTKTIVQPIYATIFCPSLLRALGAKIGAGSEISTVSHITPNLLEVGEGSFLADACLVGGQRIHGGTVEVGKVSIGARSFIGNSAVVSGGHTIGSNSLIGAASTPPANVSHVPNDTKWFGAPGFALPQTQQEATFDDKEIFAPTRGALIARTLTDTTRILLPGSIFALDTVTFVTLIVVSHRAMMPTWLLVLFVPLLASALAFVSMRLSALVKVLFIGRIAPVVKPLWSRFIWNNELVNGVYEAVAAPAMTPLMGTPFLAAYLRLMGCKVGKWCYLGTTLFSEFDLVEIGDRACLNMGATIQTHLFEDRVFKADVIKIDDNCSVGNMAVVLYGTEMRDGSNLGPLSVLMKGEMLPEATRWHGTPCEPVAMARLQLAEAVKPQSTEMGMNIQLKPEQWRAQESMGSLQPAA